MNLDSAAPATSNAASEDWPTMVCFWVMVFVIILLISPALEKLARIITIVA